MKKKLLLAVLVLSFQACNSGTQSVDQLQPDSDTVAQSASSASHAPAFLAKIKAGKNYNAAATMKALIKNQKNSICGKDDMQEINSYDGKLGQTVEFVKAHQASVGAMEETNSDSSSKFCSGAMISEDLFLTASHCIDTGTTSQYVAFNYEKAKGSSKLLPQTHAKILEVVENGQINNGGIDYSILRLDGKPGVKFGFNKINKEVVQKDDLLTIIQHPSGYPKKVEVGHKGGNSGVYMGYPDLDTSPGSSGSTVLDKDGKAVGVHTNGGCGSTSGENKAVMMSEIVKVSKTIQTLAARQFIQDVELPDLKKVK